MTEKEIQAKLEQVFEGLVMTQCQRDTLKDIIIQASKASVAGDTIAKITNLEPDDEITDVINTVNNIINAFK